jgi:hypothetical protein
MDLHNPLNGILRCSRYSFGPNRLHLCGPEANKEILAYIKAGEKDPGLASLMGAFATLSPYLQFIARVNGISDPFDERVVEAYWLGNELLENIERKKFFRHLTEDHKLKKRMKPGDFAWLTEKVRAGAVPHHSFHVLNVWMRTGHVEREHTLESLDSCRIGWGTVTKLDGGVVIIETEPLLYEKEKLVLGSPVAKKVTRHLTAHFDIEQLKVGELVSTHWGVPCEVITKKQAAVLRKYTLANIELANKTI